MNIQGNHPVLTHQDTIERIARPSIKEFQQEIVPSRRPVVITGVADSWRACSRWTIDFFKSLVGGAEADLRSSDNEAALFFGKFTYQKVKLADYFDDIRREGASPGSRPYLGNISFNNEGARAFLEPLQTDFLFPQYFPEQRQLDCRIWIAAPGQKSTLHNDNYHGFNAQISGVKKFILVPPEHDAYLYTEMHNEGCWVSRVDAFNPDLRSYPLFTNAERITCTLVAGEILYVPLFWWHQVYAETVTVNVNGWVYLGSEPVFWKHGRPHEHPSRS